MKAKVFNLSLRPEVLEAELNSWLNIAGNIYINKCVAGSAQVIVFYSPSKFITRKSDGSEPKCPKCGSSMRKLSNRENGNLFWGCTDFPNCRKTLPFSDKDWENVCGEDPGVSTNKDDIPF